MKSNYLAIATILVAVALASPRYTTYNTGCLAPYTMCSVVLRSECNGVQLNTLLIRPTGTYYFYTIKDSSCMLFNISVTFDTSQPRTTDPTLSFRECKQLPNGVILCTRFDARRCTSRTERFDTAYIECVEGENSGITCGHFNHKVSEQQPCILGQCAWDQDLWQPSEIDTPIEGCCADNSQCQPSKRSASDDWCSMIYCDTTIPQRRDLESPEGACTTVTRECSTERCVIDSVINGIPCSSICIIKGKIVRGLCDQYADYIAMIWEGIHNGSAHPVLQAGLAFPDCPGPDDSDDEPVARIPLPQSVACHRCVMSQLSESGFNPEVSECACSRGSPVTCESIEESCEDGSDPSGAVGICEAICYVETDDCTAMCTESSALLHTRCMETYAEIGELCDQNYLRCPCVRGGGSDCTDCDTQWEACVAEHDALVDACEGFHPLCIARCQGLFTGCIASCELAGEMSALGECKEHRDHHHHNHTEGIFLFEDECNEGLATCNATPAEWFADNDIFNQRFIDSLCAAAHEFLGFDIGDCPVYELGTDCYTSCENAMIAVGLDSIDPFRCNFVCFGNNACASLYPTWAFYESLGLFPSVAIPCQQDVSGDTLCNAMCYGTPSYARVSYIAMVNTTTYLACDGDPVCINYYQEALLLIETLIETTNPDCDASCTLLFSAPSVDPCMTACATGSYDNCLASCTTGYQPLANPEYPPFVACTSACTHAFLGINSTAAIPVCELDCVIWIGEACRDGCESCEILMDVAWEYLEYSGEDSAYVFAEAYLDAIPNTSSPDVASYIACRFAAFGAYPTQFDVCLADVPCHNDSCGPDGCTYAEHDVCWPAADMCLINPHCVVEDVTKEIEIVSTEGGNSSMIATIFYFGGIPYCYPCIVTVPIDDDDGSDYITVEMYGEVTVFPIMTLPPGPLYYPFDSITIDISHGEFYIYDSDGILIMDTPIGGIASVLGGSGIMYYTDERAIKIYVIDIAFNFTAFCSNEDSFAGDDCSTEVSCVDDGRTVCQSGHNQVCDCDADTGQCECQFIHCHDCECKECNDENACTLDLCNHTNGCCRHVAVDCNADEDLCVLRTCRREEGCQIVWRNLCDDNNACTVDSCVSSTGACVHSSTVYPGGDAEIDAALSQYGVCASVVCDPRTGDWAIDLKPVDDGRVCTIDACDPLTGVVSHTERVCPDVPPLIPIDCDAGCFVPTCSENAGGCTFVELDCDDHNPCTDDSCVISTGMCSHSEVDCGCTEYGRSESDACVICGCDSNAGGCYLLQMDCDDHNPCTNDSCDDGLCVRVPTDCDCSVGGFHLNESDAEDLCTLCGCSDNSGGCWTRKVDCDDDDPSTEDTCRPETGCHHTSIKCGVPPQGPCYVYPFDRHSGECGSVAIPKDCDDRDPCTIDSCVDDGVCVHALKCSAAETDMCAIHPCDRATGTCLAPLRKDCDDENPCTADSCDPVTGDCVHSIIECALPIPDIDNLCVSYECHASRGGCVRIEKRCDDKNACTRDGCLPSTGNCIHMPIEMDCGNATAWCDPATDVCTAIEQGCDPRIGTCGSWIRDLDDHNACTRDFATIDPVTGRIIINHEPKTCPSQTDPCLVRMPCDPRLGCVSLALSCDDENPCTTDACDSSVGCVHTPVDCSDSNPCTDDRCSSDEGGCRHFAVRCDDGDARTIDTCVPFVQASRRPRAGYTGDGAYACVHTLAECDDGDPCTVDYQDHATGQCLHELRVCKAGDDDRCVTGKCVSVVNPDPDENPWKCDFTRKTCPQPTDVCSSIQCDRGTGKCGLPVPKNCDDHDACTADMCDSETGSCRHRRIVCDDQDLCTSDSCDAKTGLCVYLEKDCRDDNACTDDSCSSRTGECVHVPNVVCNDHDKCTSDSCSPISGTCIYVPKDCDDSDWCTVDSCDAETGRCKHEPVVCEHRPCMEERCIHGTGECEWKPKNCDDHNPRTTDACNPDTDMCVHSKTPCVELDKCKVYHMDKDTGVCVEEPKDCDDKNPCTRDECESHSGDCIHEERRCEHHHHEEEEENACETIRCVPATGECEVVSMVNCDDGDQCTSDMCDMMTGTCVHVSEHCGAAVPVQPPSREEDHNDEELPPWAKCESRACDSRDGRCYKTPVDCDDEDACTEDSCKFGVGCIHVEKDCERELHDHDDHEGSRSAGRAPRAGKQMDPLTTVGRDRRRDRCILAKCDPKDGKCYRERVECPSHDPRVHCWCEPETGKCECKETACKNEDPCFVNVTSPLDGRCYATPRDCRDDDACTTDVCVRGECTHRPYDCSDHNRCTIDSCDRVTAECRHEPVHCHGHDRCMNYWCDTEVGCRSTPVTGDCDPCEVCHCCPETGEWIRLPKPVDDGDLCTIDTCVEGIIEHTPVICVDEDPCTVDVCDSATGQCMHPRRNSTEHLHRKCEELVCRRCFIPGPPLPSRNIPKRSYNAKSGRVTDPPEHQCPDDEHEHDDSEHHEPEEHEHHRPDEHEHHEPEEHEHHRPEDHEHHEPEEHEHHHPRCVRDESFTLVGAPCYPGYKFVEHPKRYEKEECYVSSCDPETGERIRDRLPDGTACRLEEECESYGCVRGTCVHHGTKPCEHHHHEHPEHSEEHHHHHGGLSTGVIVAIVIASIIGALILIAIIWMLWRSGWGTIMM